MNIREPSDPRFKDPSIFPCAVTGCDERASGWVLREAMELHEVGHYEVWGGSEYAFLCDDHLRPIREPGV